MTDSTAPNVPTFADRYVNLAQPRLGAAVVWANDEFFGAKERLIDPAPPLFVPGKYDAHGKWMDGWETRRRREPGHDSCLVRLGFRSVVFGVDVDTTHFNGNQPVAAVIEACDHDEESEPPADAVWWELVPRAPLGPSRQHPLDVADQRPCRWLRLHIFPDGGVARLRVYGVAAVDWSRRVREAECDLLAVENGAWVVGCNDAHFGRPQHLLLPGRGSDMGDGWETRRRREPGNDWVVLTLGCPGVLRALEVDTAHFKGNYPDRCSVRALPAASLAGIELRSSEDEIETLFVASADWPVLLPEQKLRADHVHRFDALERLGAVSHLRLDIYPDGGVSRLRAFGVPRAEDRL
jgi:allantoicase